MNQYNIDWDDPEFFKGDYSIASFKKVFKTIQITKKFDKVISNYSNASIKFLSEEEYKAGKSGYVLGNFLIKDI
jgi:ABC-type transporter MlaC component